MTKDFEASSQLFGSYLHQDWVEEFDTDTAAAQAMVESEPKEVLAAASSYRPIWATRNWQVS